MKIIGTVSGEGNKTEGLERLAVIINKNEAQAKGIQYKEDGDIEINLIIGNDCYRARFKTTKRYQYVYIPCGLFKSDGEKTYLQNILKNIGIQKNQKVELEIEGDDVRLILMKGVYLPSTNFKSPVSKMRQSCISDCEKTKESDLMNQASIEKPVNSSKVSERNNEVKINFYVYLWDRIHEHLYNGLPNWEEKIINFVQTTTEGREKGKRWTDNEIFEGVVKAILSSNTDWAKIERVLPELSSLFHNFDLKHYASLSTSDIENTIHTWFVVRSANSQSLKANLIRLIETSKKLLNYSKEYGGLDSFINTLLKEKDSDPKLLALKLGSSGSKHKLSGMGITIASEMLRNIGFDIAKPDRYINRALGCFGLVKFNRWSESYYDSKGEKKESFVKIDNPKDYSRPEAGKDKCLEVMRAMETFAKEVKVRPVFLDYAIWQLCARSGLYMSNKDLKKLAIPCSK